MTQSDNVPENYKDALATPDVADWMKACDVEMGKLRSLGCWEVLPRSSLPQNASVMKSRWTFRYKTHELGDLKSVSHRSRFVAKGYSQVPGLYYFENYAPVASFITIRLLFALVYYSHKYFQLWSVTIRRVCCLYSKQTRFKPSTSLLWVCRRIRRSTQKRLSPSPSCIRHERQSSRMGSALYKCLHSLRANTPQKRRMCLCKICQQLKDSNPKHAAKPGQYYWSHCPLTREQ